MEIYFPWLTHPEEPAEIDALAKRVGKTVPATGVNPGFVMDSLPLNLTAICQRVDRIEVTRVINATTRRGPFQAKIGSGITDEGFRAMMEGSRVGRVSLPESVRIVFDTLGKKLVRYESSVDPVMADCPIKTEHLEVQPGSNSANGGVLTRNPSYLVNSTPATDHNSQYIRWAGSAAT